MYFATRDEAKDYAAELRSDNEENGINASVISPSLADEATRAAALLAPFGVSLLEAARMVVTSKNAELASSTVEADIDEFLKSKSERSESHSRAYRYMKRDFLKSFTGRILSWIRHPIT
jgi:hypothetical protein